MIVWALALIFLLAPSTAMIAGELDVTLKGGYYQYREPDAGMSYTGLISGIQGSYVSSIGQGLLKVRSELMGGNPKYEGSLNSQLPEGASPSEAVGEPVSVGYDSSLWTSDSAVLLGRVFVRNQLEIRPFLGLGFRFLDNPQNRRVPFDYGRQTTFVYLPLAVDVHQKLSQNRSWGLTAELDYLLHGISRAKLSDASDKYNDLEFHQDKGIGARLSGFYHRPWRGVSFSVNPFVDVWMVGDSDTDVLRYEGTRILVKSADGTFGDYREPANITLTAGMALSIHF